MSYRATDDVINRLATDTDLTTAQRSVLMVIAHRTNPETGIAWPSQEQIGSTVGLSPRSVRSAIKQLTEKGWLAKATWYDATRRPHVKYWLPWMATDPLNNSGNVEVVDLKAARA